ncbi:hypothetical protein KC992_02730 [Candidatus Saccharibacteria bacterium]|nr:hypothetical protein [Candidatus Saccharibacteria bacterium]
MVKKKTSQVQKYKSMVMRHKVKSVLIAFLVFMLGLWAYSSYLDWRNVQDMERLLSAMQELKKDVEAETGEKLAIEADCGSVGKFAESYSCAVYVINMAQTKKIEWTRYVEAQTFTKYRCEVLSGGRSEYKNALACYQKIRNTNKQKAESIFYQYDSSPGLPR